MKNLFLIALAIVLPLFSFSQITTNGNPKSWELSGLMNVKNTLVLPGVYFEAPAYNKTDIEKYGSLKFAEVFTVNKNIIEEGQWDKLESGHTICRFAIKSPGAYSLNVIFDKFHLPQHAELYIYNKDKSDYIGPLTHKNHKKHGGLAVAPISGDEIIIEYIAPENAEFKAQIMVKSIGHDFLGIFGKKDGQYGASDDCNIDINCDEGNDWQIEKRSVCRLIINGATLCSGVLVNNTSKDQKPYILSANHCINDDFSAGNTVFVFNYESPACNGSDGSVSQSISGSELVATKNKDQGYLDFVLLELSEKVPLSYKPYYAGWDVRELVSNKTTCIHHPWGDVKKISHDYHAPEVASYIGVYGYDPNSFWKVLEWDAGTTEGGSSGSPLFDENHRVIGTLTGDDGDPNDCDNPVNDFYQMVSVSYDKYDADTLQLKNWLDPLNLGVDFLDGLDPTTLDVNDQIIVAHWESGQALAFYVANDGGYMAGNNVYNDLAKAEFFNKIEFGDRNAVTGAYIAFAHATGNDDEVIELQVLKDNFGLPATLLGTATQTLGEIKEKADVDYVYYSFDPPVEVNSSFYLSLVLPQNTGDTVAMMTVEEAETNTAWELNSENQWHPYSNPDFSWNISLAHLIALEIGKFTSFNKEKELITRLQFYPNPVIDKLTIENTEKIKNVKVFNSIGCIAKEISNIDAKTTQISLSNLQQGFYVILVETNNGLEKTKIIKE